MVSSRLRLVTLAGMFVALVFVSKLYLSFTLPLFRLSFHDVALFLSGMLLGPFFGVVIAFSADTLYALQSGFPFSFLMSLSDAVVGLSAGVFLYTKRVKLSIPRLALVVILTTLVTFGINSLQLFLWFNTGMFASLPWRLLATIIKWPISILILWGIAPRLSVILYPEAH